MSVSVASAYTNSSVIGPPAQPIVISDTTAGSLQSGGFILKSSLFSFTQTYSYSTWDLTYSGWPFSMGGLGNFYYYCPDTYCGSAGSWKQITEVSSIPNVRI
jgi:hypothetical protein